MKIELIEYSLQFRNRIIIDKSSITIDHGLNLLLGRNGSGKTSILKSFPSLNQSWKGDVYIDGINLNKYDIKSKFGFQFETDFLSNNLFPKEMLLLCGKLQGIVSNILKLKIEELLDFFEIDTNTEIQFLSYGNKKKLLLALSMLNSPKGLIWDEPFEGLDELFTEKIINLIKSISVESIIISTNNMYLAQEINSSVILINKVGKLEYLDSLDLQYIRNAM